MAQTSAAFRPVAQATSSFPQRHPPRTCVRHSSQTTAHRRRNCHRHLVNRRFPLSPPVRTRLPSNLTLEVPITPRRVPNIRPRTRAKPCTLGVAHECVVTISIPPIPSFASCIFAAYHVAIDASSMKRTCVARSVVVDRLPVPALHTLPSNAFPLHCPSYFPRHSSAHISYSSVTSHVSRSRYFARHTSMHGSVARNSSQHAASPTSFAQKVCGGRMVWSEVRREVVRVGKVVRRL